MRKEYNDKKNNDIIFLYCEKGWKVSWISFYLKIDSAAIHYRIKKMKLVRNSEILNEIPDEIKEDYSIKSVMMGKINRDLDEEEMELFDEIYDKKLIDNEIKEIEKKTKCDHFRWIKKCSCCGAILASDVGENHIYD